MVDPTSTPDHICPHCGKPYRATMTPTYWGVYPPYPLHVTTIANTVCADTSPSVAHTYSFTANVAEARIKRHQEQQKSEG